MKTSEEKKTTLNISIKLEDKKFLKMYAIKHDTTVTALIEDYVMKLKGEAQENEE